MSEEQFDANDLFKRALTSEEFRRRLEIGELDALYKDPCVEERVPNNRKAIKAMTEEDDKRHTVHAALKSLAFRDQTMREFAAANSIKLSEVLDRAKELITSTNALPRDKANAADLVRLIKGYETSDDDD
jgi:hypothetical protein